MEVGKLFLKEYRDQISRCSRCGFCQVSCPVYGATLRPAINPRGKMLILKVDDTLIDEACCSGILEEVGYPISEDRVRENCQRILKTGAKTIITGCPYSFRTFNRNPSYASLGDQGIGIIYLTQFLDTLDFGVTTETMITYHDPCDLGRHSNMYGEPRRIIRRIAPNFVEMAHNQGQAFCCGAGGGMRAAYHGTSIKMAGHCLREATDLEADILLTNCNSCLHNLSNAQKRYSFFRKNKLGIYNLGQYLNLLLDGAD